MSLAMFWRSLDHQAAGPTQKALRDLGWRLNSRAPPWKAFRESEWCRSSMMMAGTPARLVALVEAAEDEHADCDCLDEDN